jgi:outer membrane protein assembly factor BamB
MKRSMAGRLHGPVLLVGLVLLTTMTTARAQWPQWGGLNRDFKSENARLADQWPDDGPNRLWHRELGVGYSSIVSVDGVLYTMYRKAPTATSEYTIALDAKTGRTIWEHENAAPLGRTPDSRWGGQGPNSTPLIVGDHLYTVGSRSVMHCYDKNDGRVHWRKDLAAEFGMPVSDTTGYCCSPIAYGSMVILAMDRTRPLGGEAREPDHGKGQMLAAFDGESGDLVWKNLDSKIGFASPIQIRYGDRNQLVMSSEQSLVGVDADDGSLLWSLSGAGFPSSPVWNGADLIFCMSGADRAIGHTFKLGMDGGRFAAEELWHNRKVTFALGTPVRVGDYLYGATDKSMMAVNMTTGKRAWVKRGYPTASCVHADGKLIILDENGKLSLTTATPDGLTVHSQCQITERYSLTVPTLVENVLYVRDRKHIMALDLS